ncbi:hypothetical protein AtDm6_1466 [Acetobacter tropicalis]|uniref:Uncharacterized protein n=1 Tax=Acetobacter tropicalis TaxID=104102 RepID=A0A094YPR0_9PROT|nr:hypothetical protein AtDm6_1466 [Acetobacter tropicalis]
MVDACGVATVGWCYELVWIIRYFKSVWRWQELVLKGLKPRQTYCGRFFTQARYESFSYRFG